MELVASRQLLIVGLMCLCASCRQPPAAAEMASEFTTHRRAFLELRDMIRQDRPVQQDFAVGTDVIGAYWRIFDLTRLSSRWRESILDGRPRDPVDRNLNEVLARTGLTPERYDTYLELLRVVHTEHLFIVANSESGRESVAFLVYREGFAGNGCGAFITWESDGVFPKEPPGLESTVAALEPEWFSSSRCS